MYKAIIFDLDNTLYDYESINKIAMEKLCLFVCRKFAISESNFNKSFLWAKKKTKELLGETGSSHNRILYCQKLLEKLGKNPVDGALEMYDCYWGSVLHDIKPRDGTINLFKKLKSDNIKIAICTDLTAHIQHMKIRKLGLVPYIDVLVTSEEVGAEKPSEKIYSLVLEKLDFTADECLFVGDNIEKDVDAPKHLGMDSVLFTSMKDLEKILYEKKT